MTAFIKLTSPEVKTFLFAGGILGMYAGITNFAHSELLSFAILVFGAYFIIKAIE